MRPNISISASKRDLAPSPSLPRSSWTVIHAPSLSTQEHAGRVQGATSAVRLINGTISRQTPFFGTDCSSTRAIMPQRMPGAPLSRVPGDSDREAYLVPDDFGGRLGMAWRETDHADTGLERLIEKLLAGQYTNPARIVTFNTAEG